ncbi:uncharacterized protein [Rutidosis leptorrhynchoides]|uniref:uncharacterized protein isoform X2 n=1 Tax=Rutidosis leptorrhynchoides TaxID=125765 RepID=UPI003A9A2788
MASANNGVIVDRKRIIVSALYKLKSMDAFNKWVTFAEDLPLGPEGCSKGVITQLPDDLLSLIYRKLNKLCDQRSFIRTCHLFLDIAILSCKCLKVDDNDVTTKLRIAKNLKILSFRKGSYVTDECIMEISKGCPLLQVLNVSSCYREGIGLPGWVSIGLHCQNLEKLHVNNSKDLCDTGLLALGNCSKLSVLYMSDCPKVTPDGKNKFKIQRPDVKIETTMEVLFFPECTTY